MSSARAASGRLDRLDRRFYGFAVPGVGAWVVFEVIFPRLLADAEPGSLGLGIPLIIAFSAIYAVCLLFSVFVLALAIRARIKAAVVLINLSHPLFVAFSWLT